MILYFRWLISNNTLVSGGRLLKFYLSFERILPVWLNDIRLDSTVSVNF